MPKPGTIATPMHRPVMREQRGAALLLALLIAALVTIALAVMLRRQSALAGIEWQLRETAQARRVLYGAEDWALQILREDARTSATDDLGELWAIPLKEGRLADFLKTAAASGSAGESYSGRVEDVWLSGSIVDADRRYNLMRLALAGDATARERGLWLRVAAQAGLPPDLAAAVANRFVVPGAGAAPAGMPPPASLPLSIADLAAQLPALANWAAPLSELAVVLPEATTINVNTAPKPVLAALMNGLNDAQIERFMYLRSKAPWRDVNSIAAAFPDSALVVDNAQAGVSSRYFIITAGVRLVEGATPDLSKATEVGMTTTVRRVPLENRAAVVRRDFWPGFH